MTSPATYLTNMIVAEDIERILSADLDWAQFEGRTVLITGASGFLAAYLTQTMLALAEKRSSGPARMIGLVRDKARTAAQLGTLIDHPLLTLLEQDVCDPLPDDLHADFIIHAASLASPKFYRDDPIGTIRPNVIGTEQILELAARAKSTVLYISSSEVYGTLPPDAIPTAENMLGLVDPLDPRSCYAESKRMGEALCVAWHRQRGVRVTAVRPFHIYGPGMRLDDGRVFADFTADIIAGRDITLFSEGNATRSFCYIADATEAFLRVLLAGQRGTAYNVGNPDGETAIGALADMLTGLFPDRKLCVVRKTRDSRSAYMPSSIERSCPNIDRITALGWRPLTDVRSGFKRTIASFIAGDGHG